MTAVLGEPSTATVVPIRKRTPQTYEQYTHAQHEAERAAELDALCVYCGPEGSTGPDCGTCPNGPAVAA
ncbi:hypothetical protein [Micromonospora carbonacea]|uniref:Uncharacterized protein n=1 Tax=Micromonospora carbonacea TaxID=47853 RepID=A0A1C5ACW7_9ACTN|nr:hypothetical protein [Micromonospora carbonacea]SCF43092.1 hypothetical protein GA0070563_112186 [Micromonospora carbonacea]